MAASRSTTTPPLMILRIDCRAMVERTIRPIALNRKNALFARSRALAMPKPGRATGQDAGAEN